MVEKIIDAVADEHQNPELGALVGSGDQVAWAGDIRRSYVAGGGVDDAVLAETEAGWWIENRYGLALSKDWQALSQQMTVRSYDIRKRALERSDLFMTATAPFYFAVARSRYPALRAHIIAVLASSE